MNKRKIRKDGDVPLTETRQHGISFPEWVWLMAVEGQVRNFLSSRAAWIKLAMVNQAKREGFYKAYRKKADELLKKKLNK